MQNLEDYLKKIFLQDIKICQGKEKDGDIFEFEGKIFTIKKNNSNFNKIVSAIYIKIEYEKNEYIFYEILKNMFKIYKIKKTINGVIVIYEKAYLDLEVIQQTIESETLLKNKFVILNQIKNENDLNEKLLISLELEKEMINENKKIIDIKSYIYILIKKKSFNHIENFIKKEILKEKNLLKCDMETLNTFKKFIENDLNITKTSKLLYIHRNTLIYRLDKIKEIYGLDVRNFEDANYFNLALNLIDIK